MTLSAEQLEDLVNTLVSGDEEKRQLVNTLVNLVKTVVGGEKQEKMRVLGGSMLPFLILKNASVRDCLVGGGHCEDIVWFKGERGEVKVGEIFSRVIITV